jgi:hypothetical protein
MLSQMRQEVQQLKELSTGGYVRSSRNEKPGLSGLPPMPDEPVFIGEDGGWGGDRHFIYPRAGGRCLGLGRLHVCIVVLGGPDGGWWVCVRQCGGAAGVESE